MPGFTSKYWRHSKFLLDKKQGFNIKMTYLLPIIIGGVSINVMPMFGKSAGVIRMKNTTRKLTVILVLFLMVLTTACTNREEVKKDPSVTIVTPSEEQNKESVKSTVAPIATKEISIYTMNENTQDVESVSAVVNEDTEITPELIVDMVTASLAERLIDVRIDKVTTEKDTVIVSFDSDTPPVVQVNLTVETTILDAIAQSLVDNLPEYPKVIFRVKGKEYKSDNLTFGLNDVYLDGNKSK